MSTRIKHLNVHPFLTFQARIFSIEIGQNCNLRRENDWEGAYFHSKPVALI